MFCLHPWTLSKAFLSLQHLENQLHMLAQRYFIPPTAHNCELIVYTKFPITAMIQKVLTFYSMHGTNTADALSELNTTLQGWVYNVGPCYNGVDVACVVREEEPRQCRMNVRMQAAFILAGCLIIKAAYMIILYYKARGRTKEHCLTLGDVVVASVLDPEMKIKNECLLNSGDGWRSSVVHKCHKHCTDVQPSTTGDDIGHCQKCLKFNEINKAADLPHPSVAIKDKRSLLSNLGSTAIIQMLILTFTSLAMLSASIMLIIEKAATTRFFSQQCSMPDTTSVGIGSFLTYEPLNYINSASCTAGSVGPVLKRLFGTWGGFSSSAQLAALPGDSLSSKFTAFAISNGAQFLYSLLYLLLIYNLSLISMEHEWGAWETKRKRPRCTIVSGKPFEQTYFLQLPPKILLPLMSYAALMHWLLGQAISTVETIYTDPQHHVEHSMYTVGMHMLQLRR
jgi:hypothetical protein